MAISAKVMNYIRAWKSGHAANPNPPGGVNVRPNNLEYAIRMTKICNVLSYIY